MLVLVHWIDARLKEQQADFQFQSYTYYILWIFVFATVTLLILIGAMLHPRFPYVSVASMLGVYAFGNLLLLLALLLCGCLTVLFANIY
ncbi:hypothetical protein DL96DRAFT_1625160, partial [Flagelloscypha sp. PMI_526]